MASKRGLGWAPNCTRGCRHLLPVAGSGSGCSKGFLVALEHPQPCSSSPVIPQVLQVGEMWLLLLALCLAQGLEDATPDVELFHNPERFMNIVSAWGAPHFSMGMPKVLPEAPAGLTPSLHLHLASLGGLGHQKSPIFALLALTPRPQLGLASPCDSFGCR